MRGRGGLRTQLNPTGVTPAANAASRLSPFLRLADQAGYVRCQTDLIKDADARAYWTSLFADHINMQLDHAVADGQGDAMRAQAARREMGSLMSGLNEDPLWVETNGGPPRLDILVLDAVRRQVLQRAGVTDEFRVVKDASTTTALFDIGDRMGSIRDLAQSDPAAAALDAITGVLAGNFFDMGAPSTRGEYQRQFDDWRKMLPDRPWFRDDVEAATERLLAPDQHTLIFADNSGADFSLGVLPLAWLLGSRGGQVTIAANESPSLNDVTASEAQAIVARAAAMTGETWFRRGRRAFHRVDRHRCTAHRSWGRQFGVECGRENGDTDCHRRDGPRH